MREAASGYWVGVDLGGTNIKTAVLDGGLQVVAERSDATNAAEGPERVLGTIRSVVRELLRQEGIADDQVSGMGLGVPGLLDPKEGLSIFSPNFPGWANIHVVKDMSEEFSFPVFIDNDVRVNMYGEWYFGAGQGCRNLVLITIGTGLGSGVVVDGRALYGTTSSVGEIGHMNMYREGRPCRCGSSGCLGRYVSAIGMAQTAALKLETGVRSVIREWVEGDWGRITAKMLSDACDREDALALEVMRETGELLGFGLANIVNLFNPEAIIVGGGVSAAGERLLGPVRETLRRHALPLSSGVCRVESARLGWRAGMIGAAAYARRRLEEA